MSPSEVLSSNAADRAAAVPGWVQANAETLVGVPLRILLIVLGAMLVRALAKRAIARAVERILQPAEGKGEPRRSPRGPAVLQRDASRAAERRQQRARTIGSVRSAAS